MQVYYGWVWSNKENYMKKKGGKAKGGAVQGARPEYDSYGPKGNVVEGGKKGNKVPGCK